jgi:hypothetical protein
MSALIFVIDNDIPNQKMLSNLLENQCYNDIIRKKGMLSDFDYIIESGSVEVSKKKTSDERYRIGILKENYILVKWDRSTIGIVLLVRPPNMII